MKKAVKGCLEVEIIGEPMPLAGGVSGASVYQVRVMTKFPDLTDSSSQQILNLVIKFSSKETFDVEKDNYRKLPDQIKKYFINFSAPRAIVNDRFFMVMTYLQNFKTLHNILYENTFDNTVKLSSAVFEGIRKIQFWDDLDLRRGNKIPRPGRVFEFYLGNIQRSVNIASEKFPAIRKILDQTVHLSKSLGGQKSEKSSVLPISDTFKRTLGTLINRTLEPQFPATMHGDCHPRNIMIDINDINNLKFLDIDRLDLNGDYIYDFGVLLSDLEVFGFLLGNRDFVLNQNGLNSLVYEINLPNSVATAARLLCSNLENLVREKDVDWERRLSLAKARYLMSMSIKLPKREENKALVTYCEALRQLQRVWELVD